MDYTIKNWLVTLILKNGDVIYSEKEAVNSYTATELTLDEFNYYGQIKLQSVYASEIV